MPYRQIAIAIAWMHGYMLWCLFPWSAYNLIINELIRVVADLPGFSGHEKMDDDDWTKRKSQTSKGEGGDPKDIVPVEKNGKIHAKLSVIMYKNSRLWYITERQNSCHNIERL